MTELITMHTHSTFCNHAKDSLGDMVQAAVDAGIAHMAATEHYPIPDELDPSKRSTMPSERLEASRNATISTCFWAVSLIGLAKTKRALCMRTTLTGSTLCSVRFISLTVGLW